MVNRTVVGPTCREGADLIGLWPLFCTQMRADKSLTVVTCGNLPPRLPSIIGNKISSQSPNPRLDVMRAACRVPRDVSSYFRGDHLKWI